MPSVQTQNRVKSGITLLCAAEMGARVIRGIAGNDISTALNGTTASKEALQLLLLQRINNRLLARKAAAGKIKQA